MGAQEDHELKAIISRTVSSGRCLGYLRKRKEERKTKKGGNGEELERRDYGRERGKKNGKEMQQNLCNHGIWGSYVG